MSRPPQRHPLITEQRQFECRDCEYAVTAPHHQSACPHCEGEMAHNFDADIV